jgi:hypothetical protein
MNLFKVLIMSWLIGVGLSFFKWIDIEYTLKCVLMATSYLLLAVFCYRYILIELKCNRVLKAYVVSLLCVSMLISCFFNLLFTDPEMYHLLVEVKQGDGFSWKNIYKAIELIALLIVGRNGFIYLYNWLICRNRWINVIIANNSTYNLGR